MVESVVAQIENNLRAGRFYERRAASRGRALSASG